MTAATFKVFTRSVPKCSQGAEVLRAANDTWGESTITWNNQPGTTGSALAQVTTWTANKYINFDVTSSAGGGAVSFVLRQSPGCTPTGDATFHSREGAKKPRLVVETSPAPAPQCSDGVDNDSDGQTDFPNDPGCTDAQDNDETDPPPEVLFSDGFEGGDLSKWTFATAVAVQQQVVFAGQFAGRTTSTGTAAYAYRKLATAQAGFMRASGSRWWHRVRPSHFYALRPERAHRSSRSSSTPMALLPIAMTSPL